MKNLRFIIPIFLFFSPPMADEVFAQDEKENASKLPVTMNISYKISDGIKNVKVQVTRKENKKFIPVDNVIVNLYLNEIKKYDEATGGGWISNLNTNEDGEGIFRFSTKFYELTAGLHEFTFIANMNSDPRYEDTQEEITINDAFITINFSEDDSIKTITAKLTELQDSAAEMPVPETEMKLFIKRTFSLLPFGEEGLYTDENGEVSGELPLDVPGNANGTLTIVAKVEDHETCGTIEVTKDVPWSVFPKENAEIGRTLWSSGKNAPVPLVVASVSIIIVIWGTIFYLVYLLFSIKEIGKNKH